MKLSAPLYILKQQARALSRREQVRLHVALDRIAVREGFDAWSHLAARAPAAPAAQAAAPPDASTAAVFARLDAGDLVLLGARPGQGKTLLALALAAEAMALGGHAALFTLEFTAADVARCFGILGRDVHAFGDRFLLDMTEGICADHVALRLAALPPRTLVVVDYLQALDSRRDTPPLGEQLLSLKRLATSREATILCLSQISRGYDPAASPWPGLDDVRLANPADLSLFNKACFLHEGRMQLLVAG